MTARVCLVMIVRDESAVIRRCLDSVRPFVDRWLIVDTGSVDDTRAVIREHMKDIPGEVVSEPWTDFGTARTKALEHARRIFGRRCGYLLTLDADEVLELVPPFTALPELTADVYDIVTHLGGITYARPQLFRMDLPARYVGARHEFLEVKPGHPFKGALMPAVINRPRTDGARSRDPRKFLRDAEELERELEREPHNTRTCFYLAQSYRDAGHDVTASVFYDKRAAMGGWYEEVAVALYESARALERTAAPERAIVSRYLESWELTPFRAEAVCALASYLRVHGRFHLAHVFARAAKSIPRPSSALFLDESVYAWRARDEYAIACYYVGEFRASELACRRLLASGTLPDSEVKRVRDNLRFAEEKRGK